MGLNKIKKCLVAALSALFACVLTLAVWAGVSADKTASAAGETYTLKFVDTGYIETLSSVYMNGGGTATIVEEGAISGKAVKVEPTAAGSYPYFEVFENNTVTKGDTYHIRFKLKGDGTKVHVFQNLASYELIDDWIETTNEWVEYSYDYTVKNTSSENVMLFFQTASMPSSTGCYYVEDLSVEKTLSVTSGSAIGKLPTLDAGAVWTIDGETITADTVYNYGADKTAVAATAYMLTFQYPDMIESMESGSFGAVYNATYEITETETDAYDGKALHYAVGTENTGDAASPWVCLSSSTVPAGEYILKFKMKNSRYVNVQYQIGSYNYSSTTMLQANVRDEAAWTEYEYTINLTSDASSLYLLVQAHAGAGDIYIDDLTFTSKADSYKYVISGGKIGELPTIDESYVWAIDGEKITANTVYTYGENKTAYAVFESAYSLTYVAADMLDSATFGTVYNTTQSLQETNTHRGTILQIVSGTANVASHGSPWIALSASGLSAGTYVLSFQMINERSVTISYETNGNTWGSNSKSLETIAEQTENWISYQYTIVLTEDVSSLYLQIRINSLTTAESTVCVYLDWLSFGLKSEISTEVGGGLVLGALPEVPAKDGYTNGRWTIDGEKITANTVYNYGEDKTAVAEYDKIYTLTFHYPIGMEDKEKEYFSNGGVSYTTENTVYGSAVVFGANGNYIQQRFNGPFTEGKTYTLSFWAKTENASELKFSTFLTGAGISWKDYATTTITTDTDWTYYSYDFTPTKSEALEVGFKAYAGSATVYLDEIYVREVLPATTFAEGDEITFPEISVAEGYKVVWTIDGEEIVEGSVWNYTEDKTASSYYQQYLYKLTFDGTATVYTIEDGLAIGALPEVPAKDGYTNGRWTIDGEKITANTVYNYGADKTAVAEYDKEYTLTFHYPIGMEDGEVVNNGYNLGAKGTLEYVTDGALYGSALKYTIAETGVNGAYVAKIFNVEAGKTYVFSYYMNITESASLEMSVYVDSTAITAGDNFTDAVSGVTNGWVYREKVFTPNASGTFVVYFRAGHGSGGNGVAYIDEIYVRESIENSEDKFLVIGDQIGTLPTMAEKDGYKVVWMIDGEEITADTVWNYTEDKTVTYKYVQTRFTLSFVYPIGMEDGEVVNNGYNLGAKGTLEYVTDGALYGSALKYTIAETGVNGAYVAKSFTVEAGKTYAFSYYMNITESNALEMSVYAEGSAITAGDNFTDAVSGLTNGWVYREKGFTPNASGTVIVYFRAGHGSGGNGTVYIDEIYVREKLGDPITVNEGETLGALPAVPAKEGYTDGRWTIDGEIITAETVWNYSADQQASLIYVKLYTLTFDSTDVSKQLAVGEMLGELPEIPAKEGYVGAWYINGREITADTVWNYTEDLTAVIEYQIDLGIEVGINMQNGAAVRVATDGKSGIRFETRLDKKSYDSLVEKYGEENIETGTYILPYTMLGNQGIYAYVTDSTHVDGKDYVQVINKGWYNAATVEKDGYYQWFGSLVKIKPQNYSLNFVGIGYIKITIGNEVALILAGEASFENSRSIYQVAYKAYADEGNGLNGDQMGVLEAYLNSVSALVSNQDYSAPVIDPSLSERGYTATYTLSVSAETGNYIVRALEGETINSLVIDNIVYKITPAQVIYFTYYMGSATILSGDEVSAMNATIVTASELENGVQGVYTNAAWDAYKLTNQNVSLTHGLKAGNIQVTSLSNANGTYLTNTLDAYVVSGGSRVYGKTGANTYGGTVAGSARLNTTQLGYYYYETNVRDIKFNSSIPLYLSKTYHAYADKLHQQFTVVASGTASSVTALGFEMKIPVASVVKYIVDGTENAFATNVEEYIGFDINGVGVVGIIVAGDDVTVTLTNDGTYYYVRQEKAFTNILSKAADGVALTSDNTFSLWNRLYTDDTHSFDGIAAANNEEQNPLTDANITVSTEDGGAFNGYNYATGAYSFAINGAGFNTSYDNPYNQFTESITIENAPDDRTVYIQVKADKAVEGAAIMDEKGMQLPIAVQVGKNFQTEYEEPNFDPTDAQWGITVAPIRVQKTTASKFTVVNAMQKWGEFDLKQLSSISYYVGYYHLSTGVTETNCIAPYFSYSNELGSFNNAWILPDFRGGDTMWDNEPQYDSVGKLMGVNNGASTGMDDEYYGTDLGVYVGSEILSSGLTYADVEYSYVSQNGNYEYTYRHVEMPQTDEARTYYTLTLKFLKDTSIDNKAFNLFSFSSRDVKLSSYEYLNTSGTVVTGSNPTKASTGSLFWKESVQAIYPLYKGASYFAMYGVSDTTKQNGNFGLIVKDYSITVNGANSNLGLAFKNDFLGNGETFGGLTLASNTNFKAGDTITLNVILLPYGKNVNDASNVRKVYQDSVVNALNITAETGSVVSDTWIPTVKAADNAAQFTLKGGVDTTDALGDGEDSVNYAIKVTNCTKLGVPVIEEYVNGVWQVYTVASVNGYDGYSVDREADGTLTYSFVIAKSAADRTFRVHF